MGNKAKKKQPQSQGANMSDQTSQDTSNDLPTGGEDDASKGPDTENLPPAGGEEGDQPKDNSTAAIDATGAAPVVIGDGSATGATTLEQAQAPLVNAAPANFTLGTVDGTILSEEEIAAKIALTEKNLLNDAIAEGNAKAAAASSSPAVVNLGTQDTTTVLDTSDSVQTAAKPTAADVSATVVTDTSEPSKYEAYVENVRTNGSVQMKSLLMRLEAYAEAMRPMKVLNPVVGANNQRVLWDCIRGAVKNPDNDEFRKQWNLILQFFNANKDAAFGPRYVFRFATHWNKGKEELALKQVLINLIHLTADHETRAKGLRQVDLVRTLNSTILTEAERSRVQGFYNV